MPSHTTVRAEGGLIPPDLLEKIAEGDAPGQAPRDFGLPSDARLTDEIAVAWGDARRQWENFQQRVQRLAPDEPATTETRNMWVLPLLHILGYDDLPYQSKGVIIGSTNFAISHRAGPDENAPPVHIEGCRVDLDKRPPSGRPRFSPHALVQEYLNRSEHLWGIVTNGYRLRLLRDNPRFSRAAYIEFDLQQIMEGELFADFALFYRLVHRTRLPRTVEDAADCWLEHYYQMALEQGGRVRERLRDGVEQALLVFGNGFLRHPANTTLREKVRSGGLSADHYYRQLLHLVYRLLFLMVSEERGLVGPDEPRLAEVYRQHYSVTRLRDLAEHPLTEPERYHDRWQGLVLTFRLFADDDLARRLGMTALDGDLFNRQAMPDLEDAYLSNADLLQAIRYLSLYQDDAGVRRVNYAALDVEELGSVYESLLDYRPVIRANGEWRTANGDDGPLTFGFVEGTERKSTGSYYTRPELVQELVKSALEPVIEERLAEARRMAHGEWRAVQDEWEKIPQDLRRRWARDVISRLQGSGGVATGDVYRQGDLQADSGVSPQRDVRNDRPDAAGSDLHSSKHRGGMGKAIHSGVHSVHPQGERKSGGIGDIPDAKRGRGPVPDRERSTTAGGVADSGEAIDHAGTPSFSEEEIAALWPKLPFAIRYSLFAEHLLLSIKVLDPASGSGHFLLAAARRLGQELARVRTGEPHPGPDALRAAVRDVIRHCIYGVDKNPLAVDLCKVALWLEGHNKGQPLTFLDHRIKCGDSLVGVFDLDVLQEGIPDDAFKPVSGDDKKIARELKKRNKEERSGQLLLFQQEMVDLDDLADEYAVFASLRERSAEDVRAKAELYQQIHGPGTDWWTLWTACNLWTAAFFQRMARGERMANGERRMEEDDRSPFAVHHSPFITTATVRAYLAQPNAADGRVVGFANGLAMRLRFFHWPLEFPDVFARGGFDVVLGNPPFLGGKKISGTLGTRYRRWLKIIFEPWENTADLCAAFYRRAYALLRYRGRLGMVATNTIGQGDTRESGLAVILREGGSITFARRFIKWPGKPNVEVNLVAIQKFHTPARSPILDGRLVDFISSHLDTAPEIEPRRLPSNKGKAFQGDIVRGMGFILQPGEARVLLAKDSRNADCLCPYLNGEDLNNHPEQKPSRWVICFHNWTLEQSRQYPDLLRIVEERVKPERERLKGPGDKHSREYWWRFHNYRGELRRAIAPLQRVLIRSRVSELHALAFVPKGYVYGDATVVFAFDDDYHFALLQSSIHEVWLRKQASSLRTDIRYTPTDCFETFPFPPREYQRMVKDEWRIEEMPEVFQEAARVGAEYHEHRRQIMLARQIGLTKTYNFFHDPDCQDEDIVHLRELHVQMDRVILACYGWEDLDLQHGFYENERGKVRFTVSPTVRDQILRRLLELNLQIAEEEEASS